jgi:hypothetical protein
MGLGSIFSKLGSNISSGAKKLKNIAHDTATGISSGIASGAKKAWECVKEHGAEIAGTALKGAEILAPHLGPLGTVVSAASKAVVPHLAKAIGSNFEKGYNLSRFSKSNQSESSPSNVSPSHQPPTQISQSSTPGVKQAIPTTGLQPGFRAKINYK